MGSFQTPKVSPSRIGVGLKARKSGWKQLMCCVSPNLLLNQCLQLGNLQGIWMGLAAQQLEQARDADISHHVQWCRQKHGGWIVGGVNSREKWQNLCDGMD